MLTAGITHTNERAFYRLCIACKCIEKTCHNVNKRCKPLIYKGNFVDICLKTLSTKYPTLSHCQQKNRHKTHTYYLTRLFSYTYRCLTFAIS